MIQPVSCALPKGSFKGNSKFNSHSVSRNYEKEKAILCAGGISLASGVIAGIAARCYTATIKNAFLYGLGASLLSMMFVCPRQLYKSGFYTMNREKETDKLAKKIIKKV